MNYRLGTVRWILSSSSSSSIPDFHRWWSPGSSSLGTLLRRFQSTTPLLSMATTTTDSTTTTTTLDRFDASRLGLDPTENRFHAPIVYHENYSFADWPQHHTFPMDKFAELRKAVLTKSSHLPRPLVREESHLFRTLEFENIPIKDWIMEPYGPIETDFVQRFLQGRLSIEEKRYIGFREQTDRPELIERTILEVAGTVLTCQLAWEYGVASNLAGGTHHAHRTMGAGYTIINDLAVAANYLTSPVLSPYRDTRKNGRPTIQKVLVIDCDVHQGDGTAKFTSLHEEGRLITLSIHCASNYPRLKAHSTIDVGVADHIQDEEYLNILRRSVQEAIETYQPDFCLYDAGVDIYEHDKLGRLDITEDGIRKRDRYVIETCVQHNIPIAAVIGGGYDRDVQALARRHAIVHEECAYVWRKYHLWERGTKKKKKDDLNQDSAV